MSRIANSAACQTVRRWIIQREGRGAFAGFTAQDSHAFSCFVHAMELWCVGTRAPAIAIMAAALGAMQEKHRYLCKQAIPAIGDWGHVDEIWPQIGLGS